MEGLQLLLVEVIVIGASLSEPHIDEVNVRNLYIITIFMVGPSPERHYAVCDIIP